MQPKNTPFTSVADILHLEEERSGLPSIYVTLVPMNCIAIVKAYAISKGAITPFACIKLDTIIVCSSLKLVYQENSMFLTS